MKYILDIPKEVEVEIKKSGYDTKTYIQVFLINPLLDGVRKQKADRVLENRKDEIDGAVAEIASQVVVERQKV